ncbi:hypothetical protein HanLR1_Chr01g0010001 [Helianthus annuus]|nr:hypothetical protein HanLR1_Chr01g0010001 [Helianthus annuus]
MDNETLTVLTRYHKNHPESKTKTNFFGFIWNKNYQDPDPVDYLRWRNNEEMKEKSAAYELAKLAAFKETSNQWFLKEEKKKRSRKTTPKVQAEEGSSSQPKKHQKKVVEILLVDEPEEEEPEANVEGDHVRLSPESDRLLKALKESFEVEEAAKATGEEGDNEEENSSSSEEDIDEIERLERIRADIEKEKQLKRKKERGKR